MPIRTTGFREYLQFAADEEERRARKEERRARKEERKPITRLRDIRLQREEKELAAFRKEEQRKDHMRQIAEGYELDDGTWKTPDRRRRPGTVTARQKWAREQLGMYGGQTEADIVDGLNLELEGIAESGNFYTELKDGYPYLTLALGDIEAAKVEMNQKGRPVLRVRTASGDRHTLNLTDVKSNQKMADNIHWFFSEPGGKIAAAKLDKKTGEMTVIRPKEPVKKDKPEPKPTHTFDKIKRVIDREIKGLEYDPDFEEPQPDQYETDQAFVEEHELWQRNEYNRIASKQFEGLAREAANAGGDEEQLKLIKEYMTHLATRNIPMAELTPRYDALKRHLLMLRRKGGATIEPEPIETEPTIPGLPQLGNFIR